MEFVHHKKLHLRAQISEVSFFSFLILLLLLLPPPPLPTIELYRIVLFISPFVGFYIHVFCVGISAYL